MTMRFVARGGGAYTMYVHDRPVAVLANVDGRWYARIPGFGTAQRPYPSRAKLAHDVEIGFPMQEGER